MDIPSDLLPGVYLWTGNFLYLLFIVIGLVTAPWSKLGDSEAQHVYLGAIVSLSLLWVMRGGIQAGLNFHLLGVTLLCLMFEWQFALIAISFVIAITSFQGAAGWEAFGLNVMLMGVLPILFIRIALYITQRWLPHNYYIYVFINAFLAGGLSILLVGFTSAWIQQLSGVHAPGTVYRNFVQILPLLVFGEAFLNGGVITLVVAYRPKWIATFHDHWYLKSP